MGLPSAVTYFIARNRPAWRTIVRALAFVLIIQTVVAVLLLLGLNRYFLTGTGDSSYSAGLVAVASVPLLIVQYYGLHVLQGLGDILWFNIYRVAPAAAFSIGLGAGLYFGLTVLSCTAIWLGSLLATTLAVGKTLSVRAQDAATRNTSGLALPSRREMMRFGVAGFLAQVSPVETFRVDILVVAALFPSQVIGYYAVASSVSNVPRFIADGLVTVAYPQISAQYPRQGHASTRRYMLTATALCGASALAIAVAVPYIVPFLFGRSFEPAVGVSIFLVIAAALISVRRVGSDCLRALGKPGASTGIEVITLAILAAGFVVIGPWGNGRGVALSLAISAAVGLGLLLRLLRRSANKGEGPCGDACVLDGDAFSSRPGHVP